MRELSAREIGRDRLRFRHHLGGRIGETRKGVLGRHLGLEITPGKEIAVISPTSARLVINVVIVATWREGHHFTTACQQVSVFLMSVSGPLSRPIQE